MARVALVRVNPTMSTVCATTGFLMIIDGLRDYKTKILKGRTGACYTTMFRMKRSSTSMFFASAFDSTNNLTDFRANDLRNSHSLARFDSRSQITHPACSKLFCLTGTTNTSSKSPERNDLFAVRDIAEVGVYLCEFEPRSYFLLDYVLRRSRVLLHQSKPSQLPAYS